MTQQTDPREYRGAPSTGAGPAPTGPERSGAAAWVRFGAVVMMIVGVFGVIEGLVAVLTPSYYVTVGGAVFVLSLAGWGWVHLALGALVAIVGASLLGDAPSWARGTAVALVALSSILHLTFVAAAPVWSILVIALDVIVLYALITTWDEPLRARR
ncbi:DUF7144 family membrane protein [Actinomycetospora sp. CA-053990]|uniref:DUF7144 family membrane protein n=1 Tax=Actinomycetospora sp. CA-053990 TaxID=3239891 RepID=UPI003D923736